MDLLDSTVIEIIEMSDGNPKNMVRKKPPEPKYIEIDQLKLVLAMYLQFLNAILSI